MSPSRQSAAVFDSSGQLRYHGRIDDRYISIGRTRPGGALTHDLEAAIAAVAGRRAGSSKRNEGLWMLSRRCRVTLFRRTTLLAALLAPVSFAGQKNRPPTFYRDIQHIVVEQCAGCHYRSGPGPFPLLTYAEVKSHARQIAAVTRSGFMPPWPPAATSDPFEDERHLTPEQIRLFRDWAAKGAPQGEPLSHLSNRSENSPNRPESIGGHWQLGTPDLGCCARRNISG